MISPTPLDVLSWVFQQRFRLPVIVDTIFPIFWIVHLYGFFRILAKRLVAIGQGKMSDFGSASRPSVNICQDTCQPTSNSPVKIIMEKSTTAVGNYPN
ncbi:hypothetical protein M378DRAFT_165038 [Amanita muscaria Koide BX008]|uniref:Uncharacterized protein n=1 Tax=Amanita muscaria (strain Koide BX008) TaxID=946122 RepID=A0A0C2SIH1_AMAMK|nr:hypothetical protein M378DRAFT_165038 [Amanita muscaria Koide BX008]